MLISECILVILLLNINDEVKLKLQNIESRAAQVFLHIKPTKMIQLPIRIGINQIKKSIAEN